jgi:hypothetical protein
MSNDGSYDKNVRRAAPSGVREDATLVGHPTGSSAASASSLEPLIHLGSLLYLIE